MKPTLKATLAVLLAAALAAAGWLAYRHIFAPKPLDVASLRTHTVTVGDLLRTVSATGNVAAAGELTLFLQVGQKAERVHVQAGDRVQAGDVLIEYDLSARRDELLRREREILLGIENAELNLEGLLMPASGNALLQYQSDVTDAEKAVSDAEAELLSHGLRLSQQEERLAEAERTLSRSRALFDGGALSLREYELAQTQHTDARDLLANLQIGLDTRVRTLEAREAQLADARARLRNARNPQNDPSVDLRRRQQQNAIELSRIELSRVREDLERLVERTVSPVDGHVSHVYLTEGQTTSHGAAVVTLHDRSALKIKADICEFDAPMVRLGQDALVSTQGSPGVVFYGVVTDMAAAARQKEASDDVVLAIEITLAESPEDVLLPGFSADIELVLERAESTLSVPLSAIGYDDGQPFVYVINGGQIRKTPVTVGLSAGRMVQIVKGLSPGNLVAAEPIPEGAIFP
jgi:HlyD family secretion protein